MPKAPPSPRSPPPAPGLGGLTWRFRLGPFPVAVDPSFWLLGLMALSFGSLAAGLMLIAVMFASVLVHELGHALMAHRYGSPASIRLYALGGLTFHQPLPRRTQRIAVSLAGPFAGFALGLVALAAYLVLPAQRPPLLGTFLSQMLWVNFGWGAINLLPVPPLDGGNVFAEAVGPRRKLLAAQVGTIVGALAAVELGRRFGLFAAVMFGYFSVRCALTWFRLVAERRLREQMEQAREQLWEDALAQDNLSEPNRRLIQDTLAQLQRRDAPPAAPAQDERDPALLARIFEEMGQPARALPHALEALEREPTDPHALTAVRLLGAAGRRGEAEALLRRFAWSSEGARQQARQALESVG
jgi:Zn-dependent protease